MLPIPEEIESVIQAKDAEDGLFTEWAVHSALRAAADKVGDVSEDLRPGALAEMMAFGFMPAFDGGGEDPWRSFFRPMMSGTLESGEPFYSPDIRHADSSIVEHWAGRSHSVRHPILRARYADLVWDLGRQITQSGQRDVELARAAIDAYLELAATESAKHTLDRFQWAKRGISLAIQIGDEERTDRGRGALLELHHESKFRADGTWWPRAYDFLISSRRTRLTDAEREALVADLETTVASCSDAQSDRFNPHDVEDAGRRLVTHYTRLGRPEDVRRIWEIVARAHEHHASLGTAMLASHFLAESLEAFKRAGLHKEVGRVRVLMEQKIEESRGEMTEISTEVKVDAERIEAALQKLIVENDAQTLANIAVEFLLKPDNLRREIENLAKVAPLMSMLSRSIVSDNRVVGIVGAVADDILGQQIQHGLQNLNFNTRLLDRAVKVAIEHHAFTPDYLVGWVNQRGLFESDTELLRAGFQAWQDGDYAKSLHLLIPQVERALRAAVGTVGRPVTKAGHIAGTSVAINMGDIIYDDATISALGVLGPYLKIHFACLFCDPRGWNLRNDFAHGLLSSEHVGLGPVLWLVHSLLVLGCWEPPAN